MSRTQRIFLIGPMGAGKSTIGRLLAELLHKRFLDSDHEIERRTGASIALIFDVEGEAGFRRRETAVLEELTRRPDVVLATGGGAVLAPANREALKTRGVVIYLHAPVDTLAARTHRDRNRPLLRDGERRARLEEIVRAREPLYRETADLVALTDERAPAVVAQEIVAKLRSFERHENLAG